LLDGSKHLARMIRPAKEAFAFQKQWKQAVAEQNRTQWWFRVSLHVVQCKFPFLAPAPLWNSFWRKKQQDRGAREACLVDMPCQRLCPPYGLNAPLTPARY